MKKELILVNKSDQVVGYQEKMKTHKDRLLHRAFSLFIYSQNDKKFLLQKRSISKYHSGGKWSNSCCSHPYKSETWCDSLNRAVSDELNMSLEINRGIKCDSNLCPKYIDKRLFYAGSFIYSSDFEEISENELDYVFVYLADSVIPDIHVNPLEVSELIWLKIDEIEKWLKQSPDAFSSWFEKAFALVKDNLGNLL